MDPRTLALAHFPAVPRELAAFASGAAPIAERDVALWLIDIRSHATDGELSGLLTAGERARADRSATVEGRQRALVSRAWLRRILAHQLGEDAAAIEFATGTRGKPVLAGASALRAPTTTFNVSHSGRWVLIGLALGGEIGVDVEEVNPARPLERVAGRAFGPGELQDLRQAGAGDFALTFFRIWSAREAFLKALGVGLSGWSGVDIVAGDGVIAPGNRGTGHEAFQVHPDPPGAVASVVVSFRPGSFRMWQG